MYIVAFLIIIACVIRLVTANMFVDLELHLSNDCALNKVSAIILSIFLFSSLVVVIVVVVVVVVVVALVSVAFTHHYMCGRCVRRRIDPSVAKKAPNKSFFIGGTPFLS